MNKTVVWVAAIIAAAAVAVIYIWSSHNRYYIATSSKGIAYEVDRKTGKSWALIGGQKIPQQGPDKPGRPLPNDEKTKITGNARLSPGSFRGKIYNGSSWKITRVIINVVAKEDDGSIRWDRDLSVNVSIVPLATSKFSVLVAGDAGIKTAPWYIKQVFGYQE